nr:ATP synthase F0 subunit 8 [Stroggylocephalus agrestis]WRK21274.1 ATP synthase F0 subunit 8 [Stroggylocephalus agrestis]
MPQMAPMWWLTLMMIIILTMFLMNSIIYFNKNFKSKLMLKENKNMNWKW